MPRKIIAIAVATLGLAIPAAAQAHGDHACRSTEPQSVTLLDANKMTTCAQARRVERHVAGDMAQMRPFRLDGRVWKCRRDLTGGTSLSCSTGMDNSAARYGIAIHWTVAATGSADCHPVYRVDMWLSARAGLSCVTARVVERYAMAHEFAGATWHLAGHAWQCDIVARPTQHTLMGCWAHGDVSIEPSIYVENRYAVS
jgi:hypothetical protein